jgi:beta-fructofuranosidase
MKLQIQPLLFMASAHFQLMTMLYKCIGAGISLLTAGLAFANDPILTNRVACGDFVKIYDASAGERAPWYINDHCFIQDQAGVWHMFGITHQEPAAPEQEIFFAHATAKTLLQQPWHKQPFALVIAPEAPWNETHLWAPYVVFHNGLYYMFYCAGGADPAKSQIHLVTSTDLQTWTRSPGNPMVVDGFDARDPFVLRLKNKWVMYYCANSKPEGGNHVVATVTSDDLVTWTNRTIVFTDPSVGTGAGNTESPFVVERRDLFYLFIGPRGGYDGTDVFVSHDPFHWDLDHKVGHFPAHAAEIVRDIHGKWYISRAGWGRGGVYLAPLTWNDGQGDSPESPSARTTETNSRQ